MVIGAFPAAKLGLLAIRQISKPIANVIKDRAKKTPFFRNYICMPPAQLYNWVEVKTKMWALNLGKPVTVPPLNEAMAIELGANLLGLFTLYLVSLLRLIFENVSRTHFYPFYMLGEFIIFFIGAGVLIFEYSRQSINEAKKQEALKQEKALLTQQLAELGFRVEKQDTQIRELTRVLAYMESYSLFRWRKERLRDYDTFDPNEPDQQATSSRKSDYNAQGGLVSKALHYLETNIFVTKEPKPKQRTDSSDEVDDDEDEELQPYVINRRQPTLQ